MSETTDKVMLAMLIAVGGLQAIGMLAFIVMFFLEK